MKLTLQLWEYLPLKQGLRPYAISKGHHQSPLRVSSIKTRIKTSGTFSDTLRRVLWEHLPLKQGLRHVFELLYIVHSKPLGVSSIKTRIKTVRTQVQYYLYLCLWAYLPLQQGLRQQSTVRHTKYESLSVSSITTRIKTNERNSL